MELQHYLQIIRRWWWLVVGLPLVVAVASFALGRFGATAYSTRVAMVITQQPIAATSSGTVTLPDYNNYNSWLASEFIVDDLPQIVTTQSFATDVATAVKTESNLDVPIGEIAASLSAEREHRTVYLTAQSSSPERAIALARGAITALQTNGLKYWGRQDTATLDVAVNDQPTSASPVEGNRGLLLNVAVRTLLALFVALGLAFVLNALDRTLRRSSDVESLGLNVVGTIPEGSKL